MFNENPYEMWLYYLLSFYFRESMAFATEPVFASLANLLGCYENLPEHVISQLKEHKMFEVEIKYGLLQVNNP